MSWNPNGAWQDLPTCPDQGWRTAKVFNFAALPAHDFLEAGDGEHRVNGVDLVLSGSAAASAFDIVPGTGLVWTRTGAGTTRLAVPLHDLWAFDDDDRWRALVYVGANQVLAAGDILGVAASAISGAPSGNVLVLTASLLTSSGDKVRTNNFWSSAGTAVDTAHTLGASPVLELDVWRTHMEVRTGSRTPGESVPAPGTLTRVATVGHRLGSGNTAAEWGSANRFLHLTFTASAASTLTVRRLVIQRLLTGT